MVPREQVLAYLDQGALFRDRIVKAFGPLLDG